MQEVLGCFQERLAYSEEPMEDIAGEKEIKMTSKILNLNTVALMKGKQHRKHYIFHFLFIYISLLPFFVKISLLLPHHFTIFSTILNDIL